MATLITHALLPCALALCIGKERVSGRFLFWACVAAILPDIDVVAFKLGIAYSSPFGHRGFTHSLMFAAWVGVVASYFNGYFGASKRLTLLFFSVCCASHPLLDALTNGGLGVAFFWPIDSARYFLPWQPIDVSPIGLRRFLTPRGLQVLMSEMRVVWLPLMGALLLCLGARRALARGR
jgi:inner membrane protein